MVKEFKALIENGEACVRMGIRPEDEQTPKQIFDDEVKKNLIIQKIKIGQLLTEQLNFVYDYLMGIEQPSAQELIDEVSNRRIVFR